MIIVVWGSLNFVRLCWNPKWPSVNGFDIWKLLGIVEYSCKSFILVSSVLKGVKLCKFRDNQSSVNFLDTTLTPWPKYWSEKEFDLKFWGYKGYGMKVKLSSPFSWVSVGPSGELQLIGKNAFWQHQKKSEIILLMSRKRRDQEVFVLCLCGGIWQCSDSVSDSQSVGGHLLVLSLLACCPLHL